MVRIREATSSDNDQLVALTAATPMKGVISLRIDRKPDFFSLLSKRGKSKVLVATENNRIVGVFSSSTRCVFIDGKKEEVCYLSDLKIHPDFRGKGIAVQLAKEMLRQLKADGVNLLFATVADGNDKVMPFFQGKIMPKGIFAGNFFVYQILPTSSSRKLQCEISERSPIGFSLDTFYNSFNKRYQFGLVFSKNDFSDTVDLLAIENGKVNAAISMLDTVDMKQNVVVSIPIYLKLLTSILKFLRLFFPLPYLPKVGEPIRMLNLRAWGYTHGYEAALVHLLQKARQIAFKRKYSFISVGLHSADPLNSLFRKLPKITFVSKGMINSLQGEQEKVKRAVKGVLFEDFSLV